MNISKITFTSFSGIRPTYKDSFRDDELFNENDNIDSGYSSYDDNDLPVKQNSQILDYDYAQDFNVTTPPEAKSPYINIRYSNLDENNVDNRPVLIDANLLEACTVLGKTQKRFSGTLFNNLKKIQKENKFDITDLVEICNAVKLKKADGSEYIDYELLQAGLYCRDKIKKSDISDIKRLINELKTKDDKGNEIFNQQAFETIKALCNHTYKKNRPDADLLIQTIKAKSTAKTVN